MAENASLNTETSAAVAERLPSALPSHAAFGAVVAPQFEAASAPLAAAAPAWRFNAAQIALLGWAAGAMLVLARLLLGTWRTRRSGGDGERWIEDAGSLLTNRPRGRMVIRERWGLA